MRARMIQHEWNILLFQLVNHEKYDYEFLMLYFKNRYGIQAGRA
jgi:hypothetical protein